jgi:hypothetical protein
MEINSLLVACRSLLERKKRQGKIGTATFFSFVHSLKI